MSKNQFSPVKTGQVVNRWWRERLAEQGFPQTLIEFTRLLWQFLRDSTPSRRRLRYGDMDYDWDHRVDTTSATVSSRDRLLGMFLSPYQPTEPDLFHEMLDALQIDLREFTFIDLGSGKGRTLLMAADYPFRRIVGVELLSDLHARAVENIRRARSESQKCLQAECLQLDARVFVFPCEPTVLYLFNPLPESGLRRVIENLEESLIRCPRAVYVLYHNPLLEHVLAESKTLVRLRGTPSYVLYATP